MDRKLQYFTFEESYTEYLKGKRKVMVRAESEQAVKDGTFTKMGGQGMRRKEPMKYTGDLIEGIATMHKSNAVPVMKGTNQAKDIAKMRRG